MAQGRRSASEWVAEVIGIRTERRHSSLCVVRTNSVESQLTLDAAASLAAPGPVGVPGADAVVVAGETHVVLSDVPEGTGVDAAFSIIGDAGSSSGIISSDAARFALPGHRVSSSGTEPSRSWTDAR